MIISEYHEIYSSFSCIKDRQKHQTGFLEINYLFDIHFRLNFNGKM